MKVLFDHNVPKKLRQLVPGHDVSTSREMHWDALGNGDLLNAAELNGFEVMVTGDKNLSYQQNLKTRKLALLVLEETDWNILKHEPGPVVEALAAAVPGSFQTVVFKHRRERGLST